MDQFDGYSAFAIILAHYVKDYYLETLISSRNDFLDSLQSLGCF